MTDPPAADLSAYALDLLRPWWLLGLALIPALWVLYRRSLVDFPRGQRVASLLVRSAVVVLLVLALAGLTLLRPTAERYVVFAVDESLSVGPASVGPASVGPASGGSREANADRVRAFLEAVGEVPAGDEAVVLPFAAEVGTVVPLAEYRARLNAPPPASDEEPGGDEPAPDPADDARRRGTDIAAALRVALAAAPPDRVRRVVLLSDGNETAGDAVRAALAQFGENRADRVDAVALPTRADPEVQVSEVVVPAQVARGEPFFVEVAVDSNHADAVTVEVFRGPLKVVSERQELQAGENRFRFRQTVDRDRLAEYTVRVSGAEADTLVDNNAAGGLVYAAGKPRVLLIDSDREAARSLEWALAEEDVELDVRPPRGVPEDVSDLQNYEVVVLSNVPATDLSSRQMAVMRTYVRDLGGGLVMLGGDQSFGLGGYYRSVLEEVLPVRSDFEKEKEKPSLAMVLVIDKSGSMGGQKIELAKDAARAAVELLGPKDQLGIIAFDGQPTWVSDVRPASDKAGLENSIATIGAGGGDEPVPRHDRGPRRPPPGRREAQARHRPDRRPERPRRLRRRHPGPGFGPGDGLLGRRGGRGGHEPVGGDRPHRRGAELLHRRPRQHPADLRQGDGHRLEVRHQRGAVRAGPAPPDPGPGRRGGGGRPLPAGLRRDPPEGDGGGDSGHRERRPAAGLVALRAGLGGRLHQRRRPPLGRPSGCPGRGSGRSGRRSSGR